MSQQPQISAATAVTQGRIMTFAFAGGVATLAAVALFVGPLSPEDRALAGAMRLALVGLAAAIAIALPLLQKALMAKAASEVSPSEAEGEAPTMPGHYLGLFILTSALIEGVGLFAAVILLLTGDWLALVVVAVAITLLLIRLPSQEKLAEFGRELRRPGR